MLEHLFLLLFLCLRLHFFLVLFSGRLDTVGEGRRTIGKWGLGGLAEEESKELKS